MTPNDLENLVYGLNNKMRRSILKILSNGPKTVVELANDLNENKPIYRQSINRSLEILRSCGFVSKDYDPEKKALYYTLNFKKLQIDLSTMEYIVYE